MSGNDRKVECHTVSEKENKMLKNEGNEKKNKQDVSAKGLLVRLYEGLSRCGRKVGNLSKIWENIQMPPQKTYTDDK